MDKLNLKIIACLLVVIQLCDSLQLLFFSLFTQAIKHMWLAKLQAATTVHFHLEAWPTKKPRANVTIYLGLQDFSLFHPLLIFIKAISAFEKFGIHEIEFIHPELFGIHIKHSSIKENQYFQSSTLIKNTRSTSKT